MLKMVLVGITAVAIAGGTLAFAQQGPGGRGGPDQRWRPSTEDRAAFADARIAAMHVGLKLTSEQEKNWPAVETALRDVIKQHDERRTARAEAKPPQDPIVRLNRAGEAMQAQGAALKKLADAAGPLYGSLDDAQKHRLIVLARVLRPHGGPDGWRGGHDHGHGGAEHGWRRMFGPEGPRGPMGPQDGGRERL